MTGSLLALTALASVGHAADRMPADPLHVVTTNLGVMGTGTRMFRCGLAHSSGVVYLGTYGPQPAVVWKYIPDKGQLVQIGAPGEYQLDCMVEALDGKIYIGTAYNAIVYQLDPATDKIKSLGSPPIDSTSWIFAMACTKKGEIYGAKGVGLFRLDWKNERLEAIGLVPGNHRTIGENTSSPIVRMLVEDADGNICGDTNRHIFKFNPATGKIELLADMAAIDPACYAVSLANGGHPTPDQYLALYSRYSGKALKDIFYVLRAATGKPEPLSIADFPATASYVAPFWWKDGADWRLLTGIDGDRRPVVLVVDPFERKVVDRWTTEVDNELGVQFLPGPGLHAISGGRSCLLKADPLARKLVTLAANPTPVECRCLAISPQRVLGIDSYDCGYAFTWNLATGTRKNHGKVWADDHRCNYGPAAFAGRDGRYFLGNHSEGMPSLWVTDTETDEHWRLGESAVQLLALRDGTVWGTAGRNPATYTFQPGSCWIPKWQAEPGSLFRYQPGARTVETLAAIGTVGVLIEAPGNASAVFAAQGNRFLVLDAAGAWNIGGLAVKSRPVAGAADSAGTAAYCLLEDGSLLRFRPAGERQFELVEAAPSFGPAERGFFVLPRSKRVVGVAADGRVTVFDPAGGGVRMLQGAAPLSIGPAVDPAEDAWYYASDTILRFALASGPSPGPVGAIPTTPSGR